MPTCPYRLFAALALSLAPIACNDVDPLDTSAPESTYVSISGNASGNGSASGNTSASGSASASTTATTGTTGEPDGTTGEPTTGAGGVDGKEACDRYIECVSVTNPNGLPDAQDGFGDDSNCWKDPEDAALCIQACMTALGQSHEAFPAEPKCYTCLSDAECNPGDRCLKGGCTSTDCGDGIVQAEEMCDGQEGCDDDCLGGPECNPLTDLGCQFPDRCHLTYGFEDALIGECADYGNNETGYGTGCGEDPDTFDYIICSAGLECVPVANANFQCAGFSGCCTPFCDLGAPSCPDNFKCTPYANVMQQTVEPALTFLGVCVP
jgi:hypothetical protein